MPPHPLLAPLPKPMRKRALPSWESRIQTWLSYVDPTISAATQRLVRSSLQSMLRGLAGKQPTTANLHLWLRERVSKDRVSAATLQLERVYANRFFEWCVAMAFLDKNPLAPIPHVPVPVFTGRAAITEPQYAALCEAAIDSDTGMLMPIKLGWYTGARMVDIAHMKWSEIDWAQKQWSFVPRKTRVSGRGVTVPLFGEVLEGLEQLRRLAPDNALYVFRELQALHERADGSPQRLFNKVRDAAGVPKNVTFHCLRHTRITRMLNSEQAVDLITAANLLGLASVETLRKYNHSTPERIRHAMML